MRRSRDGGGPDWSPPSTAKRSARKRGKKTEATTPVSARVREAADDSPERKAVWQSPKRDTKLSGGSAGSATKIKGFVRSWRERRNNSDHAKAEEVVGILKYIHGQPQPGVPEPDSLDDRQEQVLQSFVHSLQSFSAALNSPSNSQVQEEEPQSVAIEQPPPLQQAVEAEKNACSSPIVDQKTALYVQMIEKEVGQIMALYELGLVDLDDDPLPLQQQEEKGEENAAQEAEQKRLLISAELLALDTLVDNGWWDEPSTTASKDAAKRSRISGDEPVPKFPSLSPALQDPQYGAYTRLRVLELGFGTFESGGVSKSELVLRCVVADRDSLRTVVLRDEWITPDTPIYVGDILHFIGEFSVDNPTVAIVDRENNFAIIHPDRLIRVTSIGDAVSCLRRSVLSEKMRIYADGSEMIFGTLIHSIFEVCVCSNDFSDNFVETQAENLMPGFIERLYGAEKTEAEAYKRIYDSLPLLRNWAERFLQPQKESRSFGTFDGGAKLNIKINKVLDIEQQVWCPMWGITGKVDVVLQAQIGDAPSAVVPLELKTGPTPIDRMGQTPHRAQVILYTVLLEQAYGCKVESGLLYYSANSAVIGMKRNRMHLAALIQQRNAIAFHLSHERMPALKKEPHFCNSCAQAPVCSLVHRAVEGGNAASSGMAEKFTECVGHLTPNDAKFYAKWDAINRIETSSGDTTRSELWTLGSQQREETGKCLAQMMIAAGGIRVSPTRAGSDQVTLERARPEGSSKKLPLFAKEKRQMISVGDHVVLSSEDGRYGVMTGFVVEMTEFSVIVDVRGPFALPPVRQSSAESSDFHGLIDIEDLATWKVVRRDKRALANRIVWRLDLDALATEIGVHNRSLAWLMRPESTKLRSLIVDMRAPVFKPSTAAAAAPNLDNSNLSPLSRPENQREEQLWAKMHASLNVYQLRAIEAALNACDYSLVLGVPGSGKTATMSWMVAVLVLRGQSVLVTGFTHASVDALLRKLVELKINFVRLAPGPQSVHPDIRPFVVTNKAKTVAELRHALETPLVVGATCLQVKHALFSKRRFDVCIVDEATQITMSAVLGPLRCADRFVLVGDHYQLPPFVKSPEARDLGMGQSLFYSLSKQHPSSVSMLEYQYRMNSDIMLLCNALVYNYKLRCGSEQVARSSLIVKNLSLVPEGWLREACDPRRRAVMLDTDPAALGEDETGRGVNAGEAHVVAEIVRSLIETCGVEANSIGVISPYRAQVSLLQETIGSSAVAVEVNTIDRCQGRDWDVIILSLVKSNDAKLVGDLLTDWRRLNVAISRARNKLIIVGDQITLQAVHLLQEMFKIMRKNDWIVAMPPNYQK